MDWFVRDFDHPAYFEIYQDKEAEAEREGPALARLLDLPRGSAVLDLPCGWGRLSPALAAAGYRVIGGDLSRLNLERLRRDFPGLAVRLDLRSLPFRAASADGVFCAFTSWGYFASDLDNQKQLDEFARVLRPGGALLLDLAGRGYLWAALAGWPSHFYDVEGRYRERVQASADGRRIITDRICRGERFRHDIWIPSDTEVRACLWAAGFRVEAAYGDLDGGPWRPEAERWIYRCRKEGSIPGSR